MLALAVFLIAGLPLLVAGEIGPKTKENPSAAGSVRESIDFLRREPTLLSITGASIILAGVDSAWFVLLVALVDVRLGYGATAFGLLLAVGAAGGLVGAWLAGSGRGWPLEKVTAAVFGSMSGSLLLLGLAPSIVVTAMVLVLTSGGFALWNVFTVSARQRLTPQNLWGRVGAIYRTVVVTAALLGALLGGLIAAAASIEATLVGGAALLLISGSATVRQLRAIA